MGPGGGSWTNQIKRGGNAVTMKTEPISSDVPYSLVFLLWIVGLYAWYASFVDTSSSPHSHRGRSGRRVLSSKRPIRKTAPLSERASLKNV